MKLYGDMIKIKLTLLLLLLQHLLFAQTDSSYTSFEVTNDVYAIDYVTAKSRVRDFIRQHNLLIQYQNDSKSDFNVKFTTYQQTYFAFDSLVMSIGYSKSKTINSVSNAEKVAEINLELNYLRKSRDAYADLLSKVNEQSESYLSIWNEKKQVEEKIFNKERELIAFDKKDNSYTVTFNLNDEVTSPENTGVSFVNMPGVEFSFLQMESAKRGLSAKNYNGYFLKYLFTRGKSYVSLGVYKNNDEDKSDTTVYNELFVIGFGQDFYSRHLGRGARKFLNLYSGYSAGGLFASGETKKSSYFYVAPSIGIELFKNKYILLDTKINYLVPLNTDNKNLRGIAYNAAFNFVF